MERLTPQSDTIIIRIVGAVFGSFFVFGTFFPETWWSTHWLAFGDPVIRFAWLGLGLGLMLYPWLSSASFSLPGKLDKLFSNRLYIALIALGAGLLMYHFPIAIDVYGDAVKVLDFLDQTVPEIPKGTNEGLFTFSLSPWSGHQKVLSIITYIAYWTGLRYQEAFLLLDSLCGALFVALWLNFIHHLFRSTPWRIILGAAGIASPYMLIFWGHAESYAPVFLIFLGFCIQLHHYSKQPSTKRFLLVIFLFVLSLQVHPVALLFLPATALAFVRHQSKSKQYLQNWKSIGLILLLPIFLAGMVLYFFVFKDHNDSRWMMETAKEFDHLFLPLFSPPAPLDTYNLLSLNHIFNYFCEMLIWSPLALMILFIAVFSLRKKIAWNTLIIQIFGVQLILFVAFLFMLNPLLSMQMDWDLMAIPAISLLVFVAVLVKEHESLLQVKQLLPLALGMSLLSLPNFYIHSQQQLLSHRLEASSIRIYNSYYEWAHKYLQYALDMRVFPSRQGYEAYKLDLLRQFEASPPPGINYELSRMYKHDGRYYLREAKQPQKALPWLKAAHSFYPKGQNECLYLMEAHFLLGDFANAYAISKTLIDIQYPSRDKSLSIAIECASRAGLYDEALFHSEVIKTFFNSKKKLRYL
jgi:hypothetical protein